MEAKLALFLPLISSILAGFFALRSNNKNIVTLSCILMSVAAICSILLFLKGEFYYINLFSWISVGEFSVDWGIRIDQLSIMMMIVVNVVSAIVHIYSIGYMSADKNLNRFISYLSLFTFFMLILVCSNNLLQLFVGWEGVGLCSYLLIGFWYKKESANKASVKAFVANRVGDLAFIVGMVGIYVLTGSLYFDEIFSVIADKKDLFVEFLSFKINYIDFIAMSLFIGCMGKSAQLGLHIWLPDAMEGPTPVSALIHAATMVTAGVFLVIRMSALFELSEFTLRFMTIIGALTAIFAATIAITQNDIKKVIAYSTCSQLGYMFFACGVSAYQAAMFHLVTHAFFKALLFLTAGSIIYATHHEQDMRKMGGLYKKIPLTYIFVWIGSLAIAGIPPFAGFYSKDVILESAYMAHTGFGSFAYALGLLAAILTAFYSWRLIYLVFHGAYRGDCKKIEKVPFVMSLPLVLLAVGSVFAGFVGYYMLSVVEVSGGYFSDVITISSNHNALAEIHHTPFLAKYSTIILVFCSIILATIFYVYKKELPSLVAAKFAKTYRLLSNKWFVDELYNFIFIKPFSVIATFFSDVCDKKVIDGCGPVGVVKIVNKSAGLVRKVQTGYIYHYATSFILGMVLIIAWLISKN